MLILLNENKTTEKIEATPVFTWRMKDTNSRGKTVKSPSSIKQRSTILWDRTVRLSDCVLTDEHQ